MKHENNMVKESVCDNLDFHCSNISVCFTFLNFLCFNVFSEDLKKNQETSPMMIDNQENFKELKQWMAEEVTAIPLALYLSPVEESL